jgi:hypothetical protein
MHGRHYRLRALAVLAAFTAAAAAGVDAAAAPQTNSGMRKAQPKFSEAVAFDTSKPLRELVKNAKPTAPPTNAVPAGADRGYSVDTTSGATVFNSLYALQPAAVRKTAAIGAPVANFEGLSNQDNFNLFGVRVNPPDTNGDVGPNNYVEMINLAFAVYDKAGNRLLGPSPIGSLWSDFAVPDCTDPSGDPVVLYDQTTDRWILTQFTTRGLNPATPTAPFYNCVAVSQTGDPTGAYYRYAFRTQPDDQDGGYFFPDYPKYGVWSNSYIMTTRDFGFVDRYGISVYALEKNKMVNGEPNARAVQFFLEAGDVPINTIGDGLLPPDIDGNRRPSPTDSPAPIVGTQDDGAHYGATFDALNIWELSVHWRSTPTASIALAAQLPTEPFDSIYPCAPTSRDCLPQPGITNPAQYLDILSYRQRPTFRLAYRNFGTYETLVTNQSVEARPATAGARWYEIRRVDGTYSIQQQGTYAPSDGVHRWMGSAAMDKNGNIALGYSVVNGVDVYPGIRYTGRLAGDPAGQMTLGEGVIINGSGVQRTTNSRWGDYSSLDVDPTDDCTFWYANEYYTLAGQLSSTAGWQTRIASFRLPGCG